LDAVGPQQGDQVGRRGFRLSLKSVRFQSRPESGPCGGARGLRRKSGAPEVEESSNPPELPTMTVTGCLSHDGTTLTLQVVGRFDFKLHGEFRRAYEGLDPRPSKFVVDLSRAEYLDSSALGMLLLLKQHAGGERACVALARPRPAVAKVLDVASFGRLFQVA
jgi:HptB-dependent secretion and biofilm anti anti-sigma factor